LWQWLHHKEIFLEDGRPVTMELYKQFLAEEFEKVSEILKSSTRDFKKVDKAKSILNALVLNEKFEDFLTTRAYTYLL
jgi:malate synthase